MARVYKQLLKLYPAEYRALFGEEMSACFETTAQECRERGVFALLCYAVLELIGLVRAACGEWIARLSYAIYHSKSYITDRCLPDNGLMRPAGVARSTCSVTKTQRTTTNDLIDPDEMCVNAHQRFVLASSPRRLLILTCATFLPMHRR
jgi:hypothetical protein